MSVPSNYYDILANIESSNDPLAKAKSSSASGLYQFTKSVWTSLGGSWGSDPSQPFGGLTPSAAQQTAFAQELTNSNANVLQRAGVAINNASLYAAHFLGAGSAAKVLHSDPSTPLSDVVSPQTISSNPFLSGMNVGDFNSWLQQKTGGSGSTGGTFRQRQRSA